MQDLFISRIFGSWPDGIPDLHWLGTRPYTYTWVNPKIINQLSRTWTNVIPDTYLETTETQFSIKLVNTMSLSVHWFPISCSISSKHTYTQGCAMILPADSIILPAGLEGPGPRPGPKMGARRGPGLLGLHGPHGPVRPHGSLGSMRPHGHVGPLVASRFWAQAWARGAAGRINELKGLMSSLDFIYIYIYIYVYIYIYI